MTRGVSVFDFDGTIIKGDSITLLLKRGHKAGYVSLCELMLCAARGVLYHMGLMSETRSKTPAHAFLGRMAEEKRADFLRAFARDLAAGARPEALNEIRARRQAGDLIVLCSASLWCYMRYVAGELGADALLCTPSDERGRMTGPNCKGAEKPRRVRAWLLENDLDESALHAGYGDSAGDQPILSLCARPVLVNPKRGLVKRMPGAERVCWREKKEEKP